MITAVQGMSLACGAEALQKIPWSVKIIDSGGILGRFYLKHGGLKQHVIHILQVGWLKRFP